MDMRFKFFNRMLCLVVLVSVALAAPVYAKSAAGSAAGNDKQRYIVILNDMPLAAYDGRAMHTPERNMGSTRLSATANRFTGARKLDVNSPGSKKYLKFLDERFESFRGESALRLGRQLRPTHRYRNAVNGFAAELSEAEVLSLREVPGVRMVFRDEAYKLETDSGPKWIGADKIFDGSAGPFPASGGENIVVAVIDSGINWDHNSFVDPGEGGSPGYDHVNPYITQLGLCSQNEVLCNDKLVGVYDFVEDDPGTVEVEQNNNGKDNVGHGSLTASIAVGNPLNITLSGTPAIISGVAPNANIISYRVCYLAGVDDAPGGTCLGSAIFSAIEQAIIDKVDVVNHSIGSGAGDPWGPGSQGLAFLNLRAAGVFVATSAGNEGPVSGTVNSPANAPWITAVGAATHDRVVASAVESLSGGDTPPPNSLIGASLTSGIDVRKIVHAKDYGSALCGSGEPQSGADCNSNTGVSNPFLPGTFNGEIVVCDRGEYGRVEKGKNLFLAGAGGYILANTEEWGEATVADNHCLPATHLGLKDSDELRDWLGSGLNHQGALSGSSVFHVAEAGDRIPSFSSRGPGQPPIQNVLKPDVIAPGVDILGASSAGNTFQFSQGTSLSSPFVAGGAALLKSIHADWTPPMIVSALMMTATPELAIDFDGSVATPFKRGAGRVRLDQAANAGLYLNETEGGFLAADPDRGGDPKNLNLPGLVDTACRNNCAFQRTVTDLVGGATWSASTVGFANGVSVDVSPDNFTLANDASRQLTISIDLTQSEVVGSWIYGEVRLSSNGLPDAVFPVAVFADGGELPYEWKIDTSDISGWREFELSELSAMPDATYTSGGLVEPTETVRLLPQDPTEDDPYDGGEGVMTVWHTVPAGTLWLHAETLQSTSADLDLFVGLDTNGDGIPQQSEELCTSTSPTDIEFCDLFTPLAGEYWVLVQNWEATNALDEVTLKSAVVGPDADLPLMVSGSGIVPSGANQKIRISWDSVGAVPGTELMGAVGIGTRRDTPNNIGIVPVIFTKTAVAPPETLVLMNGIERGLTIGAGGKHDHMFVDIPPGTDSFTVSASINGANNEQNADLELDLYRVDFDDAFSNAPFVAAADTSGTPLHSDSGSSDAGPTIPVTGNDAVPGRWFAVLKNTGNAAADVEITADIGFSGTPVPLRSGLWQPMYRENLSQGYDYSATNGYRGFLWYTYDDDGTPVWYLASNPETEGNIWVAELLRFTNDGALQQFTSVGQVSITLLAEEDSIFSFVLFGENGSDRMLPSLPPVCPIVDGTPRSYDGVWGKIAAGLGGATVVVNEVSQGFLQYIYDDSGKPVWLAGTPVPQSSTNPEADLLQFSGFCWLCSQKTVTIETVGLFTRDFVSETSMTWNLNYVLKSPLSGSVDRTDDTIKFTPSVACQ